jgi:YD repeat-containing protein
MYFGFDQVNRLQNIRTPNNEGVIYAYDAPGSGCSGCWMPSSVTYQDNSSKQYLYNESAYTAANFGNLLTGVIDELGVRNTTVTYDGFGKATSSQQAGGVNLWQFANSQSTDPLGAVRNYGFSQQFNAVVQSSESQPAGAGSAAATNSVQFDANGNANVLQDFNGNVINLTYDQTRNLETMRVEAYGTPQARTISTTYHPYWALRSGTAEPKKITTWVYNGQPDPTNGGAAASCAPTTVLVDGQPIAVVCKVIEQATTDLTGSQGFGATSTGVPRITQYTYDGNGQVLTIADSLGNVTTNAYYTTASIGHHSVGDLNWTQDAKGHVTTFTQYDGNGRLLAMADPNGVITTFTYAPRGWLLSTTVTQLDGSSRLTQFGYTATGQLQKVTMPDGSFISYSYDPAHRLQGVSDSANDSITYTLDNAGNRTLEQMSDPSGTLTRNVARMFDVLGRMQTLTGASIQ